MAAFARVADAVRDAEPQRLAREVLECFREQQLLIAAGGIAFRVLLATVTGTLCLLGLLGFFDLSEIWRHNVAPDVRGSVSPDVFRVIDQAVTHVLEDKAFYWVTIGAAIAVWQFSGVVRASGQTLNRVYGVKDERSLREEIVTSVTAGAIIGLLLLATLATVRLAPLGVDALFGDSALVVVVSLIVRWALAVLLMLATVAVVARAGPAIERPAHWITFGSGLTVAGWAVLAIALSIYLTQLASYGSVYGALLATFLLVEFLYVAAAVFLAGFVVDRAIEQRQAT
jgi:membrane protein